jgi:hypothetical protein
MLQTTPLELPTKITAREHVDAEKAAQATLASENFTSFAD